MISIDYQTFIIYIPQSYLTFVSGTLYNLDVDQFRLDLKEIEESPVGMAFPDTHRHATEITIVGVTYARFVEILAPYSVEFEDGQYTVTLSGANNNIFDVAGGILVQNQVQVIPSNAAGLIVSGSGVTTQDKTDIINGVWDEILNSHTISGSAGKLLTDVFGLTKNNHKLFNPTFNGNGELQTATVRVYKNRADLLADINVLEEFDIVATYNGSGIFQTYIRMESL